MRAWMLIILIGVPLVLALVADQVEWEEKRKR